jgi:hypothetical protein
VTQAHWGPNLFHVNFNKYSNNSPCSCYLLDNNGRHLNSKDHNNDGDGDCQYNNENDQGNDNDSNNDGKKTNLNSLLNCAIKIYNNPIYQRDLIRKDNNGKIGVYT